MKHFLIIHNTNDYMDYYPASGETLQEAFKNVLKKNHLYFGFDPIEFLSDVKYDANQDIYLTEKQINQYTDKIINHFINIDNSHFTILDITDGNNVFCIK